MRMNAITPPESALPLQGSDDMAACGDTPLIDSSWLASTADAETVYIKDEGRNPTGHVSDRDMSMVAGAASLLSIGSCALTSPGRSGVAASAAVGPFDIELDVFVPSRAPFPTKAMINVHGGDMNVVGGRYPDARAAAEAATGWPIDLFQNPYARAGRAQLYVELLSDRGGTPPDTIVIPTGTGAGITAIGDAAQACYAAGICSTVPRIVAAQPAGCAPIVEAFNSNADQVSPIDSPDTIVGELEIPDPSGGDAALAVLRETDGEAIAVPDPAGLEAAVGLAQHAGISASVAGGIGAAAATDLSVGSPKDDVVVLNPGAGGLDADVLRSHLMSKGI